MLNLAFAAMSVPAPCTISGTLTTTAAPSGGIVASTSRTIGKPAGNSGAIDFINFSFSGTVTTEYRKNAGAWTSIADGTSVTFADGDSLEVRGTGMTAGESWTFTLRDATRLTTIGTYTITAS